MGGRRRSFTPLSYGREDKVIHSEEEVIQNTLDLTLWDFDCDLEFEQGLVNCQYNDPNSNRNTMQVFAAGEDLHDVYHGRPQAIHGRYLEINHDSRFKEGHRQRIKVHFVQRS